MTDFGCVTIMEKTMKWVYRILVFLAASGLFIVCYIVNMNGTHRGHPAMAPFVPLMVSGMYVLGMRMITENLERYLWKVVLAMISLILVLAMVFK